MLNDSAAQSLCKACGLCCTGHLFLWTKLRSPELDSIKSLGVKVFREPEHRGFDQPCPLWDGVCTIYDLPQYPRFCGTYKCKLLKRLMDESMELPQALDVVGQTKGMIHDLEPNLTGDSSENFRERLVKTFENVEGNQDVEERIRELLRLLEDQFGVKDIV